MNGAPNIPSPRNEPVLNYAPGSPERAALKAELKTMGTSVTDIPAVINGQDVRGGKTVKVAASQPHSQHLAATHQADGPANGTAIAAARRAQRDCSRWRFEYRAAVFLLTAHLLAGPW